MEDKRLFLLDAFALIFRAYYALIRSPRITSTGKNTNAQFGFTNTLYELIRKENPTHLAVVFDTSAPTERHTDFADYKANRQEAPEDLVAAIPDIKRIIKGFNIPVMECDGFEADDVIGGLAYEAADMGYQVYMVTPDKDYGQLVRDNIFIYKPGYQGNGVEILGPKEVCEKWNIKRVDQVIDMLGLMGDAVDNIPGIAGVGEKTAAKLLAEYDTLENILDNADKIKGKMGEKIAAGRENAIMSKKLATIITETPCKFHEEDFHLDPPDTEALKEVFAELEFRTLAKRILGEDAVQTAVVEVNANAPLDLFGNPIPQAQRPAPKETITEEAPEPEATLELKTIANTEHNYKLVTDEAGAKELVQNILQQKEVAFDTETTGIDANLADILGMSFCWEKGNAYYVSVPHDREAAVAFMKIFQPVFDKEDMLWIGQNIKYDLTILKWYGFALKGKIYDTMLAHYVIEPEGKHNMDMMSEKYLGYEPVSIETLIGKKGKGQGSMKDAPIEEVKEYAAEDADITLQLKKALDPLLDEKEVRTVFTDVENALVPVLLDMEYEGVGIDTDFLKQYSKELEKDIKAAEESVYQQAGIAFNLASPKQLGEVLFDKMKLDDKAKKTKTGQYATGEDVLQKLRDKHKIVDDILVFRELSKLKSTYVDALPTMINPRTGRVHTNFNQSVAVTGRLSSINPNLQNIPIRTDRGREIRKAFIPREKGWLLLSADYSQIELRIVAAISKDEAMIQAFKDNVDIHTATAAKVYGVSIDDVTKDMRRAAKAVNFGIIYGQTAFGLAGSLGIGRTEAKEIIDNYFIQYPGIKQYMDDTINFARETGYVQTLMGRKRYLADINSANQTVRGFAERNAINSPIQGTAADMIKLAMIKVKKALDTSGLQSKMILQVHDELVFDVPEKEVDELKKLVVEGMESAMPLPGDVPVMAEAGVGENWLAAH
ncbi:MAG: DNA polymerase I [Chitinophagaceae bacterium]|nr:DNA polymerase I [Chitinophagaceae bacterium]MCB9044839.1 DNA polymerase I [Chitinophagales bacterium]